MLSLTEALAALPGTADGIAAHLTAQGCRGVPENPDCCPIANYLTGLGFNHAEVDAAYVEACTDEGGWDGTVPTRGIGDFVVRFDTGEWPELVSEPEADDAAG